MIVLKELAAIVLRRKFYKRYYNNGEIKVMKKYISISVIILAVFCVGVYCKINDGEIKKKSEKKVYSDIEFVKSKFPKIEEIESVSYIYEKKSNDREIGLEWIHFKDI